MMKYLLFYNLFFLFAVFLSFSTPLQAHESSKNILKEKNITIYFRFDKAVFENDYMLNKQNLLLLDSMMHNRLFLAGLDSVRISSYTSPDGSPLYNEGLALARATNVRDFLLQNYTDMSRYPIIIEPLGENWEGLKFWIMNDLYVPCKSQALHILNNTDDPLMQEQALRRLMDGEVWKYYQKNFFPYLRGSSCLMFYLDPAKTVAADINESVSTPVLVTSVVEDPFVSEPEFRGTPSFSSRIVRPVALKTNLLFDAATLLNVEVEVPVATRFSIAGEWIFPWWLSEKRQNCLEVLSGNLEARYWFKPNYAKQDPSLGRHNPLSGWFVGLYGGGGLYDLEWKREGYQGEFFIATGLSGGYVLPLKCNLSMEFSLGVGVLRTKYRHYHAEFCDIHDRWHLTRQYSGQYTWVGPTRAKVSLVWYPHLKLKKKGGKL